MEKKNIYIITGGPGFGKSSLLTELSMRDFFCGAEAAREIIEEQKARSGSILPEIDRMAFFREVVRRRIEIFKAAPGQGACFFDRGLPDCRAFLTASSFTVPDWFEALEKRYRYADLVFITPPWERIFIRDNVRRESFGDSCKLHEMIVRAYTDLGYRTCDLPMAGVHERVDFIISEISDFRQGRS